MKLTTFLLLISFASFAATGYSQSEKVTIQLKDASMKDLFSNIEHQTSYKFLYRDDAVENIRVNLDEANIPLDKILNQALGGSKFGYKILTNNLIVIAPNDLLQQTKVSGTVTDEKGNALLGVTIIVKGTTLGTLTDATGKYAIDNAPQNSTLIFSFVGMATQEIPSNDRMMIDVVLKESAIGLEEVVVIGYGTQKKVNLTGSVAAVASKDIEKLSVTQTSQLFTGLVSGVTTNQSSGQPGKDNVDITIRGLGTFSSAGNAPLVLVDGLSSSIDNVNINDIASMSVLKDAASAAIYGTRGANGVILIETKKGNEGEFKISYQGNVGLQRPTEIPQIVDSWVYAAMYNEAITNAGGSPIYSDEDIAKFRSGEDRDIYPNTRHYYNLIHSGSGFQTDHHLSFSGGTARNTYMFSLGYLNQAGLVAETNYNRYNVLLNVNSKLKENLTLNVKLSGQKGLSNEPTAVEKDPGPGVEGLLRYAIKIPNIYAGKLSNGYYGNFLGFTIEGWMDSESFISNDDLDAFASISLVWNITKSLKITGLTGYDFGLNKYELFRPVLVVDQFITQGPSELTIRNTTNALLTEQAFLNYDFSIKENTFHLLLGYSQESNRNKWIQAFRDNFPNNSLYEINAGAASNQQCSGSASEWALRSLFGRIDYDYKGKYLFEATTRYDGSSRFPENKRYGLFPSLSAGWRISEESFFNISWINGLKVRASWGKLGNQNIGDYPYQQTLTLGLNAPFGVAEKFSSGAAATVVPNVDITWESTRVADVGFDLAIFLNRLNLSVDYFDKLTSGILYNITASKVLGMIPSVQNAGVVSNKGIDFNIKHQNNFRDFSYSIAVNFSYDKNEVKELANVTKDIANGLFIGYPLRSIYGYIAQGLFVDQADINNSSKQPVTPHPGDIKFKDISGPNGVPDGKVDADYDRTIIGSTFPKYNFGASINTRYKGFDLSVQLQVVAGVKRQITGIEGYAFSTGSSPQQWMVDERWTKENPNPNAAYPRFLIDGGGGQQNWSSTYNLKNASYLRVSNIQLGYSIPENIVKKLKMSTLRFYVGVKNLLTFDHFREGWDPEMTTGYPPVRYFNIGVNVNF